MDFLISKGSEINQLNTNVLSNLFVDGFEDLFKSFKKNNISLAKAFESSFCLDNVLVAHKDYNVLGILGFSDKQNRAMKLIKSDMRKYLGFIVGSIIYRTLYDELQKPFENDGSTCYIDFLVIAPEERGKGVGNALLAHCLTTTINKTFLLQVSSSNHVAHNLYQRNGFVDMKKIKNKYEKQTGVREWIIMKCNR